MVEASTERSVIADTFAGRVHVEWEAGERAAVTPLGQLPFFIEFLKQGGLFDGWVAGCPLVLTSSKRAGEAGHMTWFKAGLHAKPDWRCQGGRCHLDFSGGCEHGPECWRGGEAAGKRP